MGDNLEANVWASQANPRAETAATAPVPTAAPQADSGSHPIKHHLNSDIIRRVTLKAHDHDAPTESPEIVPSASDSDHIASVDVYGVSAGGKGPAKKAWLNGAMSNGQSSESSSANSFASIAHAAVHADRLRAPNRSEGQLPGAERASGHGRHIGPEKKFRLHEYAVFSKFVQLGACLWLLVGMVLTCTIFLAVTINVSYAAFNASRNTNIWPLIIGLAFYLELGYLMVSSFIRTGVRMQIYIWGANFGNDPESDIFPIFLISPILTKVIASLTGVKARKDIEDDSERDPLLGSNADIPSGQQNDEQSASTPDDTEEEAPIEELVAWRVDLIGHVLYLLLLFIILAIPMVISIGICASSVIFIVFVNLCGRAYRTFRVLIELWMHPEEVGDAELRATYYSSTGFDTGKDLFSFIIKRGLSSAVFIFVASLAFSHFTPDMAVIIVSGIFIAAFLIGHIPAVRQIAYSFQKRTFWQPFSDFRKSEGHALYNGAEEWPAFVAFGLRCAIFVIGFSCLLYYDLFWRRKDDSSGEGVTAWEVGVHRIVLFLFIVIGHDVAILLPVMRYHDPEHPYYYYTLGNARTRVIIMLSLMASGLWLSLYSYLMRPCFSSSVAVVVAFLILSYRHPRCRWTNYQRTFKNTKFSKEARLERRATRNARNTLIVVILVLATSWISALAIGLVTPDKVKNSSKSFKLPSFKIPALGLPESYANRGNSTALRRKTAFRAAVCSVAITSFTDLDILDVAAMARGSYESCPQKADNILHKRERLQTWAAFNTTLPTDCASPDGSGDGVQWIEYRDMNASETDYPVSVIAVRGTSNFNDVFQDLYLWSTSALLQLSSFMGTMVTVWPADTVDLLAYGIMKFGPLDSTLVYWNAVEKKVKELREQNRIVIMTGHSLGGAVASIVASHQQVPSYAFSAPGLGYSTRRYQMNTIDLQKYTMNIVPWHDAVPCFDLQVGLVQTIRCDENEVNICVFLDLTMATLQEECEGDF
ncbi:hypothetical protein HDU67_003878 [Dinochytrium kinnereticum]|nr:hypothetical protein HDU67_003878 [Dinochytrium kinnereticum]